METGVPPSTATTESDGVDIAYSDIGEGRSLVLLHGFSLSKRVWSDLGYTAPLVDASYRVIAVDLRGHGDSGKPHDAAAYSADKEASDIKAVLDSIGVGRANFMGYSRGGRLALEFAALFPERVHKLIVGGAHPFAQDMSFYRNAIGRGMQDWIDVVDSTAGPLPTWLKRQIAQSDVHALRAAVAEDRPDISDQLSGLNRSALFYAGSEDPICENLNRSTQLVSQGEALELSGSNHISTFLHADLILPHVMRFLA